LPGIGRFLKTKLMNQQGLRARQNGKTCLGIGGGDDNYFGKAEKSISPYL